jgi:hypothetical protein
MPIKLTKVKPKIKQKTLSAPKMPSWKLLLEELESEIAYLQTLGKIVRRKIEHGEPWPTDGTQSPSA